MAIGPTLWGIQLVKGVWQAYKLSRQAANAAIKAGKASGRGRTAWKSERGAVNAAAKKNPQATATAAKVTKPSWINAAGEFTPLSSKAIGKLTSKGVESYKKARTAHQKLKKAQKIAANKKVVDARQTRLGRGLGRLQNAPGYVSKTGGRLRGAGRLGVVAGGSYSTGKYGAELAKSYLGSGDKDSDAKGKGDKKKTTQPSVSKKRGAVLTSAKDEPKAKPATPDEKIKIAKDEHGKHSKQAGRAWGAKHGIDISYDFPGMTADEYQKGLDEGTISKKLGTSKRGKLTRQAREEMEERSMKRSGGSISANNYKLRKKSSKSKSGRVSKQSSWNY